MRCPSCTNSTSHVIDTRHPVSRLVVLRRRRCSACGYRWSTEETCASTNPKVISGSGRIMPFSEERVERTVRESCAKLGISSDRCEAVCSEICVWMHHKAGHVVSTKDLRVKIAEVLGKVSPVARLRFELSRKDTSNIVRCLDLVRDALRRELTESASRSGSNSLSRSSADEQPS